MEVLLIVDSVGIDFRHTRRHLVEIHAHLRHAHVGMPTVAVCSAILDSGYTAM